MDFLIFWSFFKNFQQEVMGRFFNLRLPMGERGFLVRWYHKIDVWMTTWICPETFRRGGGSCEEQLPQNKQWKMGRWTVFWSIFLLNIEYLNMDEVFFSTSLNDNWIGILKHVGYSVKKFFKKDQSQSYANRFFKKLLPPKLVRTWARIPFLWTQGGEIQSFKKHRWTKNHVSYFSTKRTSRFPRLKNQS